MSYDPLYLPAGDLRHKISIQMPSTTRDAWGQSTQTWQTILNTRASIRALTARELATQEGLASQSTHEIKIRYPGATVRIVSGQRVISGTATYTIQDAENVLDRNRVLRLTCLLIDQTSTDVVVADGEPVVQMYRALTAQDIPDIAESQVTGLTDDLSSLESSINAVTANVLAKIGQASGIASLDASGAVPMAQLPAAIQSSIYFAGLWDASTNTPTLTSGQGYLGQMYKVSVAGSALVDGNSTWHVGDWIVFDGAAWDKIDNFEAVTSVAGRVGTVTLSASDVSGLSPSATTDTTNASNITSGTLSTARIANLPWNIVVGPSSNGTMYFYGTSQGFINYGGTMGLGTKENKDLTFTTNNAERLRIQAGGNVGIGTATPGYTLDVSSGSSVYVARLSGGGRTMTIDSYGMSFNTTGTFGGTWTNTATLEVIGTSAAPTRDGVYFKGGSGQTGDAFRYSDYHNNLLSNITSSGGAYFAGNVGIGTTSPTSALHVVGLPVYANNAAAIAGGLTAGAFYRDGGDPSHVCVVF